MAISKRVYLVPYRPVLLAAGFLAILLTAGCGDSGPATGTVSGTVTVDGTAPGIGSSISFISEDGKSPSSGSLLEAGKFSVKVPVGKMKVAIRALRPMAKQRPKQDGPSSGEISEDSLGEEYSDEKKTTLKIDVKSGSQEKNWDLKSIGKK